MTWAAAGPAGAARYFSWVSWIRLPQLSSNTAVLTWPRPAGSWVNRTPQLPQLKTPTAHRRRQMD
jgi:hypothetical protein